MIKTLQTLSPEYLSTVFNEAFSDYLLPMQLNAESLQQKMQLENIDLALSYGYFDNNELKGFILHGSENDTVYNAGTGVVPDYRGKGITQQLYAHLVPELQRRGLHKHTLEVLEPNNKARYVYEQIGFKPIRKLHCFSGTPKDITFNHEIRIQQVAIPALEQYFSEPEWIFSWQNRRKAIERTPTLHHMWLAHSKDMPVGYIVCSKAGHIRQMYILPDYRRMHIGSSLLHHAFSELQLPLLKAINVDERCVTIMPFLEASGLHCFTSQIEMEMNVEEM
jgi:GNAT superfamily N-acetyltransferase